MARFPITPLPGPGRSPALRSPACRAAGGRAADRSGRRLAAAATVCLGLATVAAPAAAEPAFGFALGGGFGYLEVDQSGADETNGPSYGLRAHYELNDSWGLELAVTDLDEVDDEVLDLRFVELSARWIFLETERAEVYVAFGGGIASYNQRLRPFLGAPDPDAEPRFEDDHSPTVHGAVGALFPLDDRFFVLTEARYRRIADINLGGSLGGQNLETMVGLGLFF